MSSYDWCLYSTCTFTAQKRTLCKSDICTSICKHRHYILENLWWGSSTAETLAGNSLGSGDPSSLGDPCQFTAGSGFCA